MVDVAASVPSLAANLASSAATPSASVPQTALQVTISQTTQVLADLTRIIQTGASATAAPVGNNLTLATALGNITVTLPTLAPAEQQNLLQQLMTLVQTQRPLTLTILPGTPPTQATLLLPAAVSAPVTPPLLSGPPAAPSFETLSLARGDSLAAIVLPTIAPGPAQSSLTLPTPSPLQTLSATALGGTADLTPSQPQISQPGTAQPPLLGIRTEAQNLLPSSTINSPVLANGSPSLPSPATSLPPGLPASSLPPVSPLANLLQPGNAVTLRVDAVLSASQSLPSLAPNQISAIVTGTGTDGQLILKSGETTLFIKAQATAPVGISLILTVDPAKPPPLYPIAQEPEPSNFAALPQALEALGQVDPQLLQQVMNLRIPQPSEALPGSLLFLFSAFKQGSVRDWLGEDATARLLQYGKESILTSITRELTEAGQSAQDNVVGQWKAFPIPLYAQQQFQALTLYVHSDRDHQEASQTNPGARPNKVRFLIDMRLSKLGAMQIDGFVQPKKLDMILRSEARLPEGLHQELRLSYVNALGAAGYTGALNFQVGKHYWMRMQPPLGRGLVT